MENFTVEIAVKNYVKSYLEAKNGKKIILEEKMKEKFIDCLRDKNYSRDSIYENRLPYENKIIIVVTEYEFYHHGFAARAHNGVGMYISVCHKFMGNFHRFWLRNGLGCQQIAEFPARHRQIVDASTALIGKNISNYALGVALVSQTVFLNNTDNEPIRFNNNISNAG